MSEYFHVEKPFLDQLAALGWKVIDQGQGFIPSDPADWLPLEPGSNDLRYTEYGISDTDLVVTFRSSKV